MIRFPGKRPPNLGLREGRLAPCPASPNCVSSQATPGGRCFIAPIRFGADRGRAMETLVEIVASLPGATVVARDPGYLHVECRSRFLGFVDDLELAWDAGAGLFQVRSASRVGYGDLGVNRRRVERIRRLFEQRNGEAGA